MAAILFCRSQPKPMRGLDLKQNELFSYTTLEQRIPNDHPLRPLRGLVDTVLASMDRDFDGLYSTLGRASIAPERLLRGMRPGIPSCATKPVATYAAAAP